MDRPLVSALIVGCTLVAVLLWFAQPTRRWAALYPLGVSATVASSAALQRDVRWSIALSLLAIALYVTAFVLQRRSLRR
jgi:hypothetical protein